MNLTGIAMKDGKPLPNGLTFTPTSRNLLTVISTGADGTDYSYYVEGDGKQTEDPEIHNEGD